MRAQAFLLLAVLATACAVRYPAVVAMREQQFRGTDSPAPLPLQPAARAEIQTFLDHGGNRFGRNPVPDSQAAAHKLLLDALENDSNLQIRADLATSNFCAIAAPLCNAAPILRKRLAVTQAIDARAKEPAVPDPIAVCDNQYCWIFQQAKNRFTGFVAVRSVQQGRP